MSITTDLNADIDIERMDEQRRMHEARNLAPATRPAYGGVDRPIPYLGVHRYAEEAVERFGKARMTDDGTWFAEADGFPGAWASGDDEAGARDELVTVIFDWALVKMDDGDTDFPVLDGVLFDPNSFGRR